MPTIGLDCMLILDGNGFWIEPSTYIVRRPRVRSAALNRTIASGGLGVGERNVDFGPAKREWLFTVVAFQAIKDYAGRTVTTTGQAYRDQLTASYEKVNTILVFTDPHSITWNVRFDNLEEELGDVRAQPDSELQYFLNVILREA
jgi:hypothetical protein